jgi:hypothetical protein
MITHLKEEGTKSLHISHLFRYVSAYKYSDEMLKNLVDDLEFALKTAKETTSVQIVDQDGECCFHVTPAGYIILMLPWRRFQVNND